KLPDSLMASAKAKLLAAAKSAGIKSSLADALISHRSNARVKVFKEKHGELMFRTKDDLIVIDPSGDENLSTTPGEPAEDIAHEEEGGEKDWKKGEEPFPGAAPPIKPKDAEMCKDCGMAMDQHGDGGSCPPGVMAQDDDDDSDNDTIKGDAGPTTPTGDEDDPDGGDKGPDEDVKTVGQ